MNLSVLESPDLFVDGEPKASLCCVWHDGLSTYVLSASHELAKHAGDTLVTWYGVDGTAGTGMLSSEFQWLPVDGGNLDAGLVQVLEEGPLASRAAYPWGAPVLGPSALANGESVAICGKYGVVYATFDRELDAGEETGEGHHFGRLLQFKYDDGLTRPGDSGAPIISLPEGMLVGMHVAHHRGDGRDYAWGVCAQDIVDAFSLHLPGFALRP